MGSIKEEYEDYYVGASMTVGWTFENERGLKCIDPILTIETDGKVYTDIEHMRELLDSMESKLTQMGED